MTQNLATKTSISALGKGSVGERCLVFDLETDGLYDSVTKIHCMSVYDLNSKKWYEYGPGNINSGLEHLARANVLLGHNIINYDIPVIRKLYPFYTFKASRLIDTLICTRLIWPKEILDGLDNEQYPQVPTNLRGSSSLKAWGYRLSDYKIEFKDFSEYTEEMAAYCKQDVSITAQLFHLIQKQNFSEASLNLEHEFAYAIESQIRSGFPFDMDAALDLVDDLRGKKAELETTLKELFPPIEHKDVFIPKVNNKNRGYVKGVPFEKIRLEEFNPGSRQQIVFRLQEKYGWEPTKTTEKGNPVLDDDILEQLPYPEAKSLAEYMLVNKRLGQIADGKNAWIKLYNNETGCIHGDLITNGCITGRCSHRNPNMGQVPAGYSPYGKECRSLFHAPQGWDLIGVDAKALELRCLAGYLANWDDGEYARVVTDESIDIHIYNQERFGVATRDISKRLLYGIAYGCGALKAGTIIDPNEKDQEILRKLGSDAINSFMSGIPALRKLKEKIALTLQERGWLRGLDGRVLYCRADFKGLNVLLQSAGAIIMKQVVVGIHNNIYNNLDLVYGQDWQQLAMIHDEIQLACPPGHTEAVMQQALQAFPEAGDFFKFGCRIDGDAKVGKLWSQTH